MKNSFSISEALGFGWATFKKKWQFLVTVFTIVFLVSMVPSWLHDWSRQNLPTTSFAFSIIGWVLQMITGIGVIVISLKLVDLKKPEVADVYKHYPLLLNYFLGSLIYAGIFILGLVLFIIPGIIWGIKYQYFSYLIVDKKMGPWEAIKESGRVTQGIKWKLFWLNLTFLGITLLGILALGLGVLVAWPVVSLAGAYVFRKLSTKK